MQSFFICKKGRTIPYKMSDTKLHGSKILLDRYFADAGKNSLPIAPGKMQTWKILRSELVKCIHPCTYEVFQKLCYTWFHFILRGVQLHVSQRDYDKHILKFSSRTYHRSEFDLRRGVEGEARKVGLFSFARPGTDLTRSDGRVLARASEPRIMSVSEPLHDSVDSHPAVVRPLGGFRPVPDHAKEGGCVDSFPPFRCYCKDTRLVEQYILNNMFLNLLLM